MSTAMPKTPKGLRPHIVISGKCNSGKSALLNALVGQEFAIVSEVAGTTTDPVSRSSELVPYGPVVFVDTAGTDDSTLLAKERGSKTRRVVSGADLVLHVMHPNSANQDDVGQVKGYGRDQTVIPVVTHDDLEHTLSRGSQVVSEIERLTGKPALFVSSVTGAGVRELRESLVQELTAQRARQKSLLEDLVRPYRLILLIVPIDLEAPAGRLILPQVQTIREVLDSDAATIVVKEREVSWVLDQLKRPPDLAITDSQVVLKADGAVPKNIPLTTFSILFSRFKGDLDLFVRNARQIDSLTHESRVLVTESCSHHTHCDDIGRVKIPRWLRHYTGKRLTIDVASGSLPEDISGYDLVVHCGGCMITRRQMQSRMGEAADHEAPITNYGVAISHLHGVLDRVLEPFSSR